MYKMTNLFSQFTFPDGNVTNKAYIEPIWTLIYIGKILKLLENSPFHYIV